ncbi:hypothetical protein E2C01_078354 [Portunus trituberculatus]|uniref:Uncharacterized protein n=1 Tax=Portunus trituberculatus TaxID=210409 RepID=A0A5B7IGS8_PORTR|nr:hypothetical protein [Portunus trituberculatus]
MNLLSHQAVVILKECPPTSKGQAEEIGWRGSVGGEYCWIA